MKKTILKRSLASTLSFLMAFSTAVPNSVVYAEESGIESEIAQDYVATFSQTQNGTTSFVTDGNKTQDPATHVQGDKVEVTVEPDEGFNTAKIEVKNTDGTVVASLEDGKVTANDEGNYTFEMPASDVTISVSFEASKKETADAETETTGGETETEKKETEEVKEEVKANIFDEFNKDSLVSKEVVDQYDFSLREIIIATEKTDTIVDKDDIVDSGNGMYVLRYATVEHAKNAYSYYYGKVDFVAPNIVVHAAEGETSEDAGLANVGAPLDTLEQLGDAQKNASGAVIAVVDSGMPSNGNVTNRVSVINGGTEVGDDNGHGTKTMDAILSVNPDAKILSIKALDANGHGDTASVYAGIEYAKNSGAKIIVLPLYAYSIGENAALSTVINDAIAKGITVVGAAGNDGANVKYYVPGNIDAAYIVGAANENGEKIASSNYGSTVDYNVIAESTSEASAKFAGFLSTVEGSYPAALEKAADEQTLIFRTDEVKKPEEENVALSPVLAPPFAGLIAASVNARSSSVESAVYDVILETTGTDLSNPATWSNWSKVSGSPPYGMGIGSNVNHVVSDPYAGESMDCVRMSMYITGHAIQKAGGNPNDYFSTVGYDFNGYGKFEESTDINEASTGDLIAYGTAHLAVALGWKDGELWTIDGSSGYGGWVIHKYRGYASSGGTKGYFSKLYKVPPDNRTWVGAYKQDENGNYVSGIKMAFYNYTGNKPSYSDLTSSVGKAKESGLPGGVTYIGAGTTDSSGKTWVETTGKSGNFCVIETDVPSKYTINTGVFDATNNKWSSIVTTSNSPTIKNNSPHVKIVKKSSNEAITKGNACYSLEGTTYELRNGSTVVATFTLDANGSSTNKAVPAGTYTLVETKAGKGYKLSDPTTVTVNQTEANQTFNVTDEPGGDPFVMSMAKAPLNGGTGNYPSTAGAEFTVKYYDGFYSSKAELPATPKYTWTYVSKAYTGTKLSKETSIVSFRSVNYLKEGSSKDGLMIRGDGDTIDIPYGTITIEETKSPASYLLNPSYVDADGNARDELILNINYDDNNAITFAGTNTSATKIQGELKADSITTLTKEIMIPVIETNLTADNGTHFTEATSEVRLVDGVTLKNCESLAALGKEIRVTGQLHDVETGELVTLENGKTSVTTVLTVNDKTEKIDNAFVFDATKYKGHTLVATEVVTMDGKELVKHDNLKDEAQMVHFPKIGTTNLSQESQRHIANIYGDIILEDTVQYENLQPDTTYTVNGKLMDQRTGKPVLDENGKEVTASTTFTTGAATDDNGQTLTGYDEHSVPQYSEEHKVTVSGTTKVTFTFKASEAAKKAAQKYVAYENIPGYATHADINDEAQTVYFPHVDTIASNDKNNSSSNYHGHNTIAMELTSDVKIKDKVVVTGVSPDAGTLRLDAYLYDVETGKQLYNADGTPVTGTKTFTADNSGNATETVYFNTIDAKNLQFEDGTKYNAEGKTAVVYEYLYSENVGVGLEAELTSTDQSVIFPEVHTTATEQKLSNKGDHYLPTYDEDSNTAYIQDVVEYKNLLPYTTYHVRGILMDKATGKPLLANGKEFVSEKDFTTGAATTDRGLVDGNVTVYFQVPASLMKGKTTVAFETITLDGLEVITHADINDQSQTDYFPGGHTTLTANDTGKHYSRAEEEIEVTDVVSYENLKPETKYIVEGRLMRAAEDGETPDVYDENGAGAMYLVDADGNFAKTVVDFTTPKAKDGEQSVSGTVDVKFTVNAANLSGRTIVAFETLNMGGRTVFIHEDIKDEAQSIHFPEIDTVATYEDDTKGMHVVENAVIKDQVKLFNISPDAGNVKLTATLYDKETGEQILDAFGNPITGTKTFTAAGDTTETVEIAFNAKNLTTKSGKYVADGRTVVVYESLTFDNNGVREHEDLTDIDQAVKFPSAHTTATDEETKDHYVPSVGVREIKDVVDFTGLLPDKTYHIKGELKNKKTGEAITDNDGNPIVVEGDFVTTDGDPVKEVKRGENVIGSVGPVKITNNTPFDSDRDFMDTEAFNGDKKVEKYDGATTAGVNVSKKHLVDGNVTVAFNVPTEKLQGVTTVAFETISIDGLEVITHANIKDEAQTDYFPGGHTTLTDSETEDHIANADKSVKLTDVVSYNNMKPETEFTVTGTLMDRETEKAVVDADGKNVTSTVKFTTPAAAEGEKTVSGEVEVVFEFNASNLENHTVVAFEKMWRNDLETDVLMWQHEDYNDKAQTVHFPEGRTTVEDKDTGNHITSEVLEEITLVDHVYYWNLLPGKEYTINGTLMDKETGKPLVDESGKEVTASATFTAPAAEDGKDSVSGVVDVTFKFKGGDYLAGKTLAAFETCQYKGKDVFVHEEIDDAPQTTYVPDGHTNLVDNTTKDHIAGITEKMSLTDTVSYENLKSGETYKVTGVLMDNDTGKEFLVNGEKVEVTKEFTIDPEPIVDADGNEVKDQDGNTMMAPVSGNIDLTFEFEGSDELKGKTLVAFETMTYKDVEIFVHKDLKDEEQTVHIPDGHTNAADEDTKDRISKADEKVTLIDTVTYSNVLAGKEYEVTGTLMNKETGEPLLVDGKEVKSTVKFTAPTPEDGSKYVSGTVDVTFKFDGSALAGKAVVAFEEITYKGITVFTHADINDNDQTDYFPDGHTTITDDNTKDQITYAQGEISITDTVHYEGLLAERGYEVTGVLYDKKTGKPLKIDGKEVTASTKFTTPAAEEGKETVDGTVDVTFKFKGSKELEDSELVAFETVTRNGAEVFVHADIDDVAQTVTVPGGKTTATDTETKNHTSYADKDVTIVDRVEYEGLLPEKEYKVEGKLMNKETGKPILVDGREVTATAEFKTPKAEDEGIRVSGSVDVTFKFDGSALAGTATVVFEDIYYNGVKVFTHADLEDEAQTVEFPSVKTSVKDAADNDRKITAKGTATMIDTVTYTNLVPGKSYTLEGVIMNKATGKPLTIDGKEVTASTAFVPEKKNGTAEVTFKFDASKVKPGNYVVFETMMETETKVVVGSHEDLDDKDQTFIAEAIPEHPKTGDSTNIFGWGALAFSSLAVGLFLAFKRKKKEEDAQ